MWPLREGTEEGNKIRRQRGWGTLELVGWAREPFYNPATNNLEWGTIARDEQGQEAINYNTRLLGRKGVISATLVTDPQIYASIQGAYQQTIAGFKYAEGHRYAEWRQGDKIAQYGLTGLVVGGGAALAAKSGFLAKFWKLLLIPLLAVGAVIKKLVGSKE